VFHKAKGFFNMPDKIRRQLTKDYFTGRIAFGTMNDVS